MYRQYSQNDEYEEELSLEDLHKLIEDNREIEIDIAQFALDQLEDYSSKPINASDVKPGIWISDYDPYAPIIREAERNFNSDNRRISAKLFPKMLELAGKGYIPSFRWLADCYAFGIGCDKDMKKAMQLYFDGMLFEKNEYCRLKFIELCPDVTKYDGDVPIRKLLREMALNKEDPNSCWKFSYRCRFAQMIIDGDICGYSEEAAYCLLKKHLPEDPDDFGFASYYMGMCLMNGTGCKADPIIARKLFEKALFENQKYYIDESWLEDDCYDDEWSFYDYCFREWDEVMALHDNIVRMLEMSCKAAKSLEEYETWISHDGLTDPDDIYEAWLKEKPLFIHK